MGAYFLLFPSRILVLVFDFLRRRRRNPALLISALVSAADRRRRRPRGRAGGGVGAHAGGFSRESAAAVQAVGAAAGRLVECVEEKVWLAAGAGGSRARAS
jgi:hypothetical protein